MIEVFVQRVNLFLCLDPIDCILIVIYFLPIPVK